MATMHLDYIGSMELLASERGANNSGDIRALQRFQWPYKSGMFVWYGCTVRSCWAAQSPLVFW